MSSQIFGTQQGRQVPIDNATLSAAISYASPTWQAGLFSEVIVNLRVDSGTATSVTMTLTGLGGSYKSAIYYTAAGAVNFGTTWTIGGTIPYNNTAIARVATGGIRALRGTWCGPDGLSPGNPIYAFMGGHNTDTTSAVTGVALAFAGGNATGVVEVLGVLAF